MTGPHAHWMLERVLEATRESDLAVLDLACGDGVLSLAAASHADRVASVLASDYSAGMCALLDKKVAALCRAASHPPQAPLRTLVADAQELSAVASDSIDVCLMAFGIMLIPDGRRAVSEMKRVVKPGGIIAIASWMPMQSQLYGFMSQIVAHVRARTVERDALAHSTEAASASSAAPVASSAATVTASMSDMPFSRLSDYTDLFSALQLQNVLLTKHTEQTGQYADASQFWDASLGSLPAFQPPPTRNTAEAQQARQWACDYVDQLWGAEAPFQLTSTSIIAIARKQ